MRCSGRRSEHPELLSWHTLDGNDVQVESARVPQNFQRLNSSFVQAAPGTGDVEMSTVIFFCAASNLTIQDNRCPAAPTSLLAFASVILNLTSLVPSMACPSYRHVPRYDFRFPTIISWLHQPKTHQANAAQHGVCSAIFLHGEELDIVNWLCNVYLGLHVYLLLQMQYMSVTCSQMSHALIWKPC